MPWLNEQAAREHTDIPMFIWKDEDGPKEALRAALDATLRGAPRKVVLDETMRVDHAFELLEALPSNIAKEFTLSTLGELRVRKDSQEAALLKLNAEIADRAMLAAVAAAKPGVAETDIVSAVRATPPASAHVGSQQALLLP